MTRPALVIGLGGTGQWVLTYLKKNLIEANSGQMPDNVKLLAFDTVIEAGAEASGRQVGGSGKEEEPAKVGTIALDEGKEFVHLGGNLEPEAQAIADGSLPYIGAWFRAKEWLKLPAGSLALTYGSGQIRQLSRFSLFMDLKSPNLSEVWTRLDTSVGNLAQSMRSGDRLDIVIVASLAGGTGSGMLIDCALLAQHMARDIKKANVQVRGYLVLPRAFDPSPDEDMKARAFAVWRELSRLMVVRDDFALPTVIYHSREKGLQLHDIKRSLFDACYLIDGVRGDAQIAAEAEHGIHPIVAEAIAAALDDQSGRVYMEHVANVARKYIQRPGVPLYSTLGAHSFKVPVYYAQQSSTFGLTSKWLDNLIKPIYDDPKNRKRITRIDPTSPYDPNKTGRDESLTILQSMQPYQDHSEVPTLFLGRNAEIITEGGANNIDLVAKHVRGSLGQKRGHGYTWLGDYTDLGDRDDMKELIQDVRKEARLRITETVKPGKEINIKPPDWPRYVKNNLPEWLKEHYGSRKAGGEENRGKFGEALDQCSQAQFDIFRRLVRLWLLRSLMGGDKSGRLGYTYDLLDGLQSNLQEFLVFMEKVQSKREEENPRLKAQEKRNRAEKVMLEFARKKFLFVVDHPKSHTTQVACLQAEQELADVRKDELLHGSVAATARVMQAYCIEVRDEIERWIRVLATGDAATGIQGLLPAVEKKQEDTLQDIEAEKDLSAAQTLLVKIADLERPPAEEEKELKRLMEGVTWEISSEHPFQLDLSFQLPGEPEAKLERPVDLAREEKREHLTQRNLGILQGFTARRFADLPAETRAAELLREQFTVDGLVQKIEDISEPLFEQAAGSDESPAMWSTLICVNEEGIGAQAVGFLHDVERELRTKKGKDPDTIDQEALIRVVGSDNPHKCTVVTTRDLYSVEAFQAWKDYEKAYRENQDMPPSLNHNFPAEVNAAEWEKKLAERRGVGYRIFHPWVVTLLEQPNRLEQFFMCYALGWISYRDDGAQKWYEFGMPGLARRYRRAFRLTEKGETQPSLFQVARAFVLVGKDQSENSTWRIDYERVSKGLLEAERQKGQEGWVNFLESLLPDPDGEFVELYEDYRIINTLHERIKELTEIRESAEKWPEGEPANFEQAYTDLSDVAELMIEERLETKRRDVERQRRLRPAGYDYPDQTASVGITDPDQMSWHSENVGE